MPLEGVFYMNEREFLEKIYQILHSACDIEEYARAIGRVEYLLEKRFGELAILDNGDITSSNV